MTNKGPLNTRPTILMAEDSESDRMLIELGFQKAKFPFRVQFVQDGVCATEYLDGIGRYANRAEFPLPVILLTDLKMPRMDGFELLEWVRRHETWKKLPVVVVTASNQSADLSRALDLGANTYVVKDLLMRPPPELFEAIQRYTTPTTIDPRKVWAQKAKKLGS